MPRQQAEKDEKLCISHFLGYYNGKFQAQYKCHGHSREIYLSELHGKKDWDWVCRDVSGNNPEMAVEILSVVFEQPTTRRGAIYNVFYKTKSKLDGQLPGSFFLRVPDNLTSHLLARQEQQNITDKLVSAIGHKLNELLVLPEGHRLDIQVGSNTFQLEKWSSKGPSLLDAYMATSFDANTSEIKDLLVKKIPDKNRQLEIPHEWGSITVLLIQSSGVPHHTEIKNIVYSIDKDEYSNIDRTFIVKTGHQFVIFEV